MCCSGVRGLTLGIPKAEAGEGLHTGNLFRNIILGRRTGSRGQGWYKGEKANCSSILRDFPKLFTKNFSKVSAQGIGVRAFINQIKGGSTVITSTHRHVPRAFQSSASGTLQGREWEVLSSGLKEMLSGRTWWSWSNLCETGHCSSGCLKVGPGECEVVHMGILGQELWKNKHIFVPDKTYFCFDKR